MVGLRTGEHGANVLRRVSHRFLWLLPRIIGGMLAAMTVYLFGEVVRKESGIVFFIPVVVMIAECAAMQAVTLSIVNGHIVRKRSRRIWQEVALTWLLTFLSAAFVALLFAIKTAEVSLGLPLEQFGIVPRTVRGLIGIVFSPLLHGNLHHLWANAVPLFVLLVLLFSNPQYHPGPTLALIWLASGLGTWLIGRGGAIQEPAHRIPRVRSGLGPLLDGTHGRGVGEARQGRSSTLQGEA